MDELGEEEEVCEAGAEVLFFGLFGYRDVLGEGYHAPRRISVLADAEILLNEMGGCSRHTMRVASGA